MKLSMFNIEVPLESELLLFNTRFSSLALLSKSESIDLQNFQKTGALTNINLRESLIENNFLLSKNVNESKEVQEYTNNQRINSDTSTFTIAPTMNCNFNCPYCYEKGFRQYTMSNEVAVQTAKFVLKNCDPSKKLKIIWYGGEPLLGIKQIEIISKMLIEASECYQEFYAEIVTNGYFLTKKNIALLNSLKVNFVQITLDGPEDIHNQRRCLTNGKPTFKLILENIKNTYSVIDTSIRINIDKFNAKNEVARLMSVLAEENLINNVGFYLAPVEDFTTHDNLSCYTSKEYAIEELLLYEELLRHGNNIVQLPRPIFGFCEAINPDDYVIDPNGTLYKCWVQISKPEGKVGNVFSGIDKNAIFSKFANYDILDSSKCRSCEVLPLCLGGCPLIRMNTKESKCASYKFNIEGQLPLVIQHL